MTSLPNVLALDLGTNTGFAGAGPGWGVAGAWELATDRDLRLQKDQRMDRRLDIRVANFVQHLRCIHSNRRLSWIVFEDVRFARSQAQAHLWASFRGALWAFANENGIKTDCLETGKLKIFATGSGAAKKDDMARALVRQDPQIYELRDGAVWLTRSNPAQLLTDDAVDAIFLLKWAAQLLKT